MAHAFAHLLFREHELEAPALGFDQRITILLLHLLLLLGQVHAHFFEKEMTLQWHIEHADDDKGDDRSHGKRLQGGNHHLPETGFAAGRCLEQRPDEATQDAPEGGGQDDDLGQTLAELDHVFCREDAFRTLHRADVVELQFHALKREYRTLRCRHSHHHGDGTNHDKERYGGRHQHINGAVHRALPSFGGRLLGGGGNDVDQLYQTISHHGPPEQQVEHGGEQREARHEVLAVGGLSLAAGVSELLLRCREGFFFRFVVSHAGACRRSGCANARTILTSWRSRSRPVRRRLVLS